MSKEENIPTVPLDVPKVGEVYGHYKGDLYEVVGVALHSNNEWVVIYKGLYKGAVAELFTRPLKEWNEIVEGEGKQVSRFVKQ